MDGRNERPGVQARLAKKESQGERPGYAMSRGRRGRTEKERAAAQGKKKDGGVGVGVDVDRVGGVDGQGLGKRSRAPVRERQRPVGARSEDKRQLENGQSDEASPRKTEPDGREYENGRQ